MVNIPVVLPLYSYKIIAIFSIWQYYRMTKHECLNLRSLVTAIAAFPALEYLYHSIIFAIAHTGQ